MSISLGHTHLVGTTDRDRDRGPDALRAIGGREMWIAALVLAAAFSLLLIVPAFRVLLLKPLWLDELHTWLLARELPGPQLVAQLSGGGDYNPPLLFAVDALLLRLLPFAPPQLVLRLTSVIAIWLAVLLLYRICRERLGVVPSAVAVTAVMTHPTMLMQLHEARFYAPWFLLTLAVAWSMQRVVEEPRSKPRLATLALLSAATCLIHYFGVISLFCLALGFVFAVRSPARMWRVAAAMGVGSLALAAWLPVYAAQRHVLSVATWVPVATLSSAFDYVRLFVTWYPYAAILLVVAAYGTYADRRSNVAEARPSIAQSAILGLLALPFVLIVFSFVVQPSLVARYALPALAGLACIIAIGVARLPRRLQELALIALIVVNGRGLLGELPLANSFRESVFRGVAAVNRVANDDRPVLALDRYTLYPVAMSAANRNTRLVHLVIPTETIKSYLALRPRAKHTADHIIVERDAAIAHNKVFGFPTLMSLETMQHTASFFVLLQDDSHAPPFARLFDGFRVCRADPYLLLFTASPGMIETSTSMLASPPCGPDELRVAKR